MNYFTVMSWDGGRSTLDNEVEQDSRQERRRDPYEEDFDRGKVRTRGGASTRKHFINSFSLP